MPYSHQIPCKYVSNDDILQRGYECQIEENHRNRGFLNAFLRLREHKFMLFLSFYSPFIIVAIVMQVSYLIDILPFRGIVNTCVPVVPVVPVVFLKSQYSLVVYNYLYIN